MMLVRFHKMSNTSKLVKGQNSLGDFKAHFHMPGITNLRGPAIQEEELCPFLGCQHF